MSEFIWKERYKIICDEITRGAQLDIWNEVKRRGLLDHAGDSLSLDSMEGIAEIIASYATRVVYECEKNRWQEADKVFDAPLPISAENFKTLPLSLANGWIEAALKDNPLLAFVNFPSASVLSLSAGSEPKPASESSPA